MDRFIASHENYSIWQLSKSGLLDLAKFVVLENYKHHKKQQVDNSISRGEIRQVYSEELGFFKHSKIYVARDNRNEIIGAIRVMEWNRMDELPITKLFGVTNLKEISPEDSNAHIWHVGRFAVSTDLGRCGIMLFKVLMMYAISPICKYEKGIMFAECDSKLFKTVNCLGLNAIALNNGMEYLGSVTIPMYATRKGMVEFVTRNSKLALHVEKSLNTYSQNSDSGFNQRKSA
ncbi:MAG TPA: hypothetical protein DEF88_09370 [Porphyromonadaceae bacterium]|jgi:hypothetical protein|nr:hypothetical protein [Porphyromonadaceae bacterium]